MLDDQSERSLDHGSMLADEHSEDDDDELPMEVEPTSPPHAGAGASADTGARQGPGSRDPEAASVRTGAAVRMAYDARRGSMCAVRTGLPTYSGYVMSIGHTTCECWFHEDNSKASVPMSLAAQCLVPSRVPSEEVTPACPRAHLIIAGSRKLWGRAMPRCIGDLQDGTRQGAQFLVLDVKRTQGSGADGGAHVTLDHKAGVIVSFHAGNDGAAMQGAAGCSLCNTEVERAAVRLQAVRGAAKVHQACYHIVALRHMYRELHGTMTKGDEAVDQAIAGTAVRHSRGARPGELHVLPTSSEVHFSLVQVGHECCLGGHDACILCA